MLYCIVLYCIVLYCIASYCIVLYCVVLYCIVLHRIVLCCVALRCVALYCILLYCIVLYCDKTFFNRHAMAIFLKSKIMQTFSDGFIFVVPSRSFKSQQLHRHCCSCSKFVNTKS